MRTIWRSLAWKEWHEHKWKLLSIVAILWGVMAYPLFKLDQGTLAGIYVGLVMGIIPLAVFVGLGTAASERSRGTLRFLQALPVPMWRVALNKLVFGLATILIPTLLALLLVFVWLKCLDAFGISSRDSWDKYYVHGRLDLPFVLAKNWVTNNVLVLTIVAASFFVWTAAAGVNRKDEVSAGAVALAIIVGWSVLLATGFSIADRWLGEFSKWPLIPDKLLAATSLGTAPGGLLTLAEKLARENRQLLLPGFVSAAVTHLALAAWFVGRFGRISNVEVRSQLPAATVGNRLDWLSSPWRSPFTAIAWKQFRESGPIVVAGLAIVVGIVVLFLFSSGIDSNSHLGEVYAGVSVVMGFVMAMVIGIGVVLNDVRPGLNTFWRSRPINSNMWFWTKFLSGLAILLVSIYGPILLIAALGDRSGVAQSSNHEAIIYPAMHIAIFAAAVAMTCLTRNAVYAAILSIATTYLGVAAFGLALMISQMLGWTKGPRNGALDMTGPQVTAGLMLTFIASAILAWLAVRYDWGKKSRF
jgi:hypothetical protein